MGDTDDINAYPLAWPIGWQRTPEHRREYSAFKQTLATARDGLLRELELMGAPRSSVVISTNIPLRRDGLPYSGKTNPADSGVAVYFTLNGVQKCIPCDKWRFVEENLQAIRLTVNALRGLERWGAKQMVDAAFAGFDALPAQSETGWWVTLGVARDASSSEIHQAFRVLVKQHHPDVGGDPETFRAIQRAFEEATNSVVRWEGRMS
jgi:hypothetical protein